VVSRGVIIKQKSNRRFMNKQLKTERATNPHPLTIIIRYDRAMIADAQFPSKPKGLFPVFSVRGRASGSNTASSQEHLMSAIIDRVAAMPKTHRVTTIWADGQITNYEAHSFASAENYALRMHRAIASGEAASVSINRVREGGENQ